MLYLPRSLFALAALVFLLAGCGGPSAGSDATSLTTGSGTSSGTGSGTGSGTTPPPVPPPVIDPPSLPPSGSTVGGYPMPTLEDERATYRAWGWTWSASVEPAAVTEPIANFQVTASGNDVKYDGEGDDLWNYLMMCRRTANAVYCNRAAAWLRYFRDDYVADIQTDSAVNSHMYGWGLLSWYEATCEAGSCDQSVLAPAEALGALSESAWSGASPGQAMAYWGARRAGRHLLLATRLAQVTNKQRWKDHRDHLIDLWINSSDWVSCGTDCGFYEIGDDDTDQYVSAGAWAAGYRVHSAFQIGILSEAFDAAYRATNNATLRSRMVAMANFVYQYGLHPTYQYSGSVFGLAPGGTVWHNHFSGCGSSCSFVDPAYTTSLVNTLVRGYKYTGDRKFLDRAKVHFARGNKTVYGTLGLAVPETTVHHFVDTKWSSDEWFLAYNKGELQYSYLIFENGGSPSVVGAGSGGTTPPPPPAATPTVTIVATPTSISSGGTSSLGWSSTNTTSCAASGGWTGTKAVSGGATTAALTATTTYTLTCTGSGGSASQSVTVSVAAPPPPPPPPGSTALSVAAAATVAGTFSEFTTSGFGDGAILVPASGSKNILEFSDEAQWNPITREVLIQGTGTGYSTDFEKFIKYNEATNSWTTLPHPGFDLGHHGYDHAALDPATGDYFFKYEGSDLATDRMVYRRPQATQSWARIADISTIGSDAPAAGAIEYFPDLGGLVFYNSRESGGELSLWRPATNAWSVVATGVLVGDYHYFTEYSRTRRILYLGGGEGNPYAIYWLNSSGVATRGANAPVPLGLGGSAAVHTVDPVSGNLLVFTGNAAGSNAGKVYEFDPAANTWTYRGTHPLLRPGTDGDLSAVAVPLYDYGVVFCVMYDGIGGSKVYLYRHR